MGDDDAIHNTWLEEEIITHDRMVAFLFFF